MREPERSDGTRLVVESLWTSHEPVAQPGAVASEGDVSTESEGERGADLAHAARTQLSQAAADAFLRDGHDIVKIRGAGLPHAVFDSEGDFGRDASDR